MPECRSVLDTGGNELPFRRRTSNDADGAVFLPRNNDNDNDADLPSFSRDTQLHTIHETENDGG